MVVRKDLPPGDRVGIMVLDSNSDYAEWDGTVFASLDVVADFEIEGTSVECILFTTTTDSTAEAVTATSAERLKIYKIFVSTNTNTTGIVDCRLGGTQVGGIESPQVGGQYVLISSFPDYVFGATDDDLEVKLPTSGNSTSFIIHYEKVSS